jgi:hypothetical protein
MITANEPNFRRDAHIPSEVSSTSRGAEPTDSDIMVALSINFIDITLTVSSNSLKEYWLIFDVDCAFDVKYKTISDLIIKSRLTTVHFDRI